MNRINLKHNKKYNYIYTRFLGTGLALLVAGTATPVQAVTSQQMQNQIQQHQQQLNQMQNEIDELQEQQDLVEEMIADLTAEIINTMTSIGLKEDELIDMEMDLEEKENKIRMTEKEYEDTKAKEAQQQEDMVTRTRRMYENGNRNILSSLLAGVGLGDLLNRMDYIEEVYEYDRKKLLEMEETKKEVLDLWDRLEEEKNDLELEQEQLILERESLEEQKKNLDAMMAKRKAESSNFDAEINQARQAANVQKKLIQQEREKLRQLQAAEAAAAAGGGTGGGSTPPGGGNYTDTGYASVIDNANGSELGKKIAKYACQYIGNPYVPGGTSLTSGADCSGFTYRVYADFGYSLPRTSFSQRSAGTGVAYADAQPGDLICYDGHVALYIGGGKIVHASTQRTGIKIGTAQYRTILAVRRII